jgi:LPS export ABC transporter protein LptC
MPRKKTNRRKMVVLMGLSLALAIFLIILAGSIGYRHKLPKNTDQGVVSNIAEKASVAIGKVHQTSTRNGVTEWRLDAASMNYFAENKQSLLKDLAVTFYLKDNSEVYLTADKGILKTASKDMQVSGNVVVQHGIYRLETKKLYYNHSKRVITARLPVKITGGSIDVSADSMSLDLNTKLTVLQGNVKGILREKIML